ncbi:MAG: MurR/RpiR family transcriptional regulator [Ruminococcaceae bacterium]|nr:MurR/RpiR family transcriptional regulator [Oscillospiraceae bacterium]
MKKDILKLIDENLSSFSKGQRQIATYISKHYDKAAYMTAAKLGAEVGVSESTVVRFVMELGFEGYPEFRRALLALIRSKLTAVQRIEVTNNLIGDADVLQKVLESDIEKIKKTLEGINKKAFDDAVRAIVDAKTVYIMGMRGSSYLAGLLNYSFRMISDNVRLIQTTSGSETFEQMMSLGETDVFIAISFPRYSKSIIKGVEYAKSRGADVIAITDSENSPIATNADQVLVAQSDMASFADSYVAPMSVINALIVAVSRECGDRFTERLHRLESVWDEYNVYDKSQE